MAKNLKLKYDFKAWRENPTSKGLSDIITKSQTIIMNAPITLLNSPNESLTSYFDIKERATKDEIKDNFKEILNLIKLVSIQEINLSKTCQTDFLELLKVYNDILRRIYDVSEC